MLAFNVATLVLHLSGTSRRWFFTSLERRDVGFQRRDVGFNHSLERRDVGSQRRDVGCFPLWNIATLHPNVATLPFLRPKPTSFFSCFIPSWLKPMHPVSPSCTTSCRSPLPHLSEAVVLPSDTITDTTTTIHYHCGSPYLAPSTPSLGVRLSQ